MSWVAVGVAVVGAGTKIAQSAAQKKKAKSLLAANGDQPIEQIPEAALQNQRQATLGANVGMPSEQYNQAQKNLQRQQSIILSRANDKRGGLALLAGTEQGYNDSIDKLNVADAQARIQNQKTLYGINNNIANWQNKTWQNNVNDKWQRQNTYAMSLLGIGNQNQANGIDQLESAAGQSANAYLRNNNNGGGSRNGYRRAASGNSIYDYSGNGSYGDGQA